MVDGKKLLFKKFDFALKCGKQWHSWCCNWYFPTDRGKFERQPSFLIYVTQRAHGQGNMESSVLHSAVDCRTIPKSFLLLLLFKQSTKMSAVES